MPSTHTLATGPSCYPSRRRHREVVQTTLGLGGWRCAGNLCQCAEACWLTAKQVLVDGAHALGQVPGGAPACCDSWTRSPSILLVWGIPTSTSPMDTSGSTRRRVR
eukprot:753263-Hanusia_phi.AAC.3